MLFEQQNRKLKTIMFVPPPHGRETGFEETGSRAKSSVHYRPRTGLPDRVADSGQSILAITSGFPVTHPQF